MSRNARYDGTTACHHVVPYDNIYMDTASSSGQHSLVNSVFFCQMRPVSDLSANEDIHSKYPCVSPTQHCTSEALDENQHMHDCPEIGPPGMCAMNLETYYKQQAGRRKAQKCAPKSPSDSPILCHQSLISILKLCVFRNYVY
eukprot:9495372-Pyramimonas_sp.AAC.1